METCVWYKTGSVDVDDHVGGDSVQAKVATIWLLTYCHWMDGETCFISETARTNQS